MPRRPKASHHKGTYHRKSRVIVAAARANPATRCWRCGRTIQEVRQQEHKPRADWTAGHLVDGQVEGPMLAECSVCNYRAGGKLRHRKQHMTARW